MNKKSIRDGIEIFPLLTFIALTKFFSLETKTNIGGWLVSWLIRLNRKFKRRITKNLELTMPHKDKADQKKFIIEFGRYIGITFTELIFNSEFQKNKDRFAAFFGGGFIRVENNMAGEDVFAKVWKKVSGMARKKVTNPIAKAWIANELAKKKRS